MCKRFDEWSEYISAYCAKNGLSFEKAKSMVQSSNENVLVLQYYDPTKNTAQGLLDETPMPVVLWVTRENGQLVFEQTEHTHKYLTQ